MKGPRHSTDTVIGNCQLVTLLSINVPVVYMTVLGLNGARFATIFRAQTSLDFQGPPLPMALVMDVARVKIIKSKRHIKKQVHW